MPVNVSCYNPLKIGINTYQTKFISEINLFGTSLFLVEKEKI